METECRYPYCLRLVGTMTVASPSRIHVSPCGHRLAAPERLLDVGDLHPPRPDVWVTDFLADSH